MQRERILFHELCHIVLGHLRGQHAPTAMRDGRARVGQEGAVEAVARALVAYGIFGASPAERVADEVAPITAYGQFIDQLLGR